MISIKDFKYYNTFAFLGYVFGSFNLFLFILITYGISFDFFIYVAFMILFVSVNFVLSSITAMYIDMQRKTNVNGSEIFYLYGESGYLSFFLIPFAYFGMLKGFNGIEVLGFFIVAFCVWLYRVFGIKKKTGFSFLNSFVSVFFPHIIFSTFISVLVGIIVYAAVKF